jgi:hypothetical protein
MKIRAAGAGLILAAALGCGGGKGDDQALALPKVYPPVRAATPTALIADPSYAAQALTAAQVVAGDTMPGSISLGQAVQERFYSGGPTSLLRIVKELDDRVASLDPRPSKHACLTAAPVTKTYALPDGQSFTVKLQCLDSHGGDWVAFGFGEALADADAGAADGGILAAEGGGDDFYLIAGQSSGNGGAYHVRRSTGDVEGWVVVADSVNPANSRVVMHLLTRKAASTLELVLGGAAVGFCSAHLKTGRDAIFVRGKLNAPPPPGTPAGSQACAAFSSGCFAAAALTMDLGAAAPACASLAEPTFQLASDLDAAPAPTGNVDPATLHLVFSQVPTGVASF